MPDIKKRELTEFEREQLLEKATELGFTISERGNEFGGGKVVTITHEADPGYYGWFQKMDTYYIYREKLGESVKLSFPMDETTQGTNGTLDEVSRKIKAAHKKCVAPEEVIVEPGAKVPERFASETYTVIAYQGSFNMKTKQGTYSSFAEARKKRKALRDSGRFNKVEIISSSGEVVSMSEGNKPPEPKKKSAGEMNRSPEEYLGDAINEEVVHEMGYDDEDDQGRSSSTPKTMCNISKAIKGA